MIITTTVMMMMVKGIITHHNYNLPYESVNLDYRQYNFFHNYITIVRKYAGKELHTRSLHG